MNTRQFYLLNWQEVGHVWVISVSFVYSALLVWAFPASSLLLAFYFPFVYMVDQT